MVDPQFHASTPTVSAWVSANAGTGKTKILVDRVLRLLLNDTDPGNITCITYTKAAAAEMRARIYGSLSSWQQMNDSVLKESLKTLTGKQYIDDTLLSRAKGLFVRVLEHPQGIAMQTIHALCQSILQRFPMEAEVPSNFRVIDEIVAESYISEAIYYVLSQHTNKELKNAVDVLAMQLGDYGFEELVAAIIAKRRYYYDSFTGKGDVERAIDELYQYFGISQNTEETIDSSKNTRTKFQYTQEEIKELYVLSDALAHSSGKKDKAASSAINAWIESSKTSAEYESYKYVFIKKADGAPRADIVAKKIRETLPEAFEIYCKEQTRISAYEEYNKTNNIAANSAAIMRLAHAVIEQYSYIKRYNAGLDFDDLLIKTIALLEQSGTADWVRYKMDYTIQHLLVDEAQDTSVQQWKLLQLLWQEFECDVDGEQKTLLVVGDFKQSIYSFQGATPKAFPAMKRYFSAKFAQQGRVLEDIVLAQSFRSTAPILHVVDAVLALDSNSVSQQEAPHDSHRIGQHGLVELWPIIRESDQEKPPPWHIAKHYEESLSAEASMVEQIADRIGYWLDNAVMLPTYNRPIMPSDIMVLLRKRGRLAAMLTKELQVRGIAVSGLDRMVLAQQLPVMDVLSVAKFLLFPDDDLNLAALLKSPFFNVSEQQLCVLCYKRGNDSVWQRLQQSDEPQLIEICARLSHYLATSRHLSPLTLFYRWLEVDKMRCALVKRNGGAVNELLDMFLDACRQYSYNHVSGLQGFVDWIENSNNIVKRDMEHGANVVRIMTIHAAKGLQAPIVILPDTIQKPVLRESVLMHHTKQASYPLYSPGKYDDNALCADIRLGLKEEMQEEYFRLLYVALTRAEEWLVICGATSTKGEAPKDSWYGTVDEAMQSLSAHTTLDENGKEITVYSKEHKAVPDKMLHENSAKEDKKETMSLPSWMDTPYIEKKEEIEVINPSRYIRHNSKFQDKSTLLSTTDSNTGKSTMLSVHNRVYGVVVHHAIEWALKTNATQREEIVEYLRANEKDIHVNTVDEVADEIIAVIQHPFYVDKSDYDTHIEAPIAGRAIINGRKKIVSGQIDQLLVGYNEVWVIDFKSSRDASDKAQGYQSYLYQMALYYEVIKQLYPDKQVRCALFWTYINKLEELSIESLTETLRLLDEAA